MGKREDVKKERLSRDFYPTIDPAAAVALKPFLYTTVGRPTRYIEPCAGGGHLIDLLASVEAPAVCVKAWDIDPQRADILQRSCLTSYKGDLCIEYPETNSKTYADCFITNPPYKWEMLKPILDHLPTVADTWMLLPADMMHNKRMALYLSKCKRIVSVGRLFWFENEAGKRVKGVDNYAWFQFTNYHCGAPSFYWRSPN